MLEFRKCQQGHLLYVAPQEIDLHNKVMYLSPEYAGMLSEHFSMSAWAGSICLGGAGIIQVNPYRAIAWALLGANAGPYMRQITRKVKEGLDLHPAKRIEITVDFNFLAGHRWARMLGFEMEAAQMRFHGIRGNDESLYARIKP